MGLALLLGKLKELFLEERATNMATNQDLAGRLPLDNLSKRRNSRTLESNRNLLPYRYSFGKDCCGPSATE